MITDPVPEKFIVVANHELSRRRGIGVQYLTQDGWWAYNRSWARLMDAATAVSEAMIHAKLSEVEITVEAVDPIHVDEYRPCPQ